MQSSLRSDVPRYLTQDDDAYFIPQVKLGTLRSLVGLCPESRLVEGTLKHYSSLEEGLGSSTPRWKSESKPFAAATDGSSRTYGLSLPVS
jgi:hypothetical protein